MPHLHPERLALLALSEPPETTETDHLATCPTCRDDLDTLRHVTDLATSTDELRDLPAAPEHLWVAIAADLGVDPGTPGDDPAAPGGESGAPLLDATAPFRPEPADPVTGAARGDTVPDLPGLDATAPFRPVPPEAVAGDTAPPARPGNGTAPGPGNGTTPGFGNGTTPGPGNGATPGFGNGTTPGAGDTAETDETARTDGTTEAGGTTETDGAAETGDAAETGGPGDTAAAGGPARPAEDPGPGAAGGTAGATVTPLRPRPDAARRPRRARRWLAPVAAAAAAAVLAVAGTLTVVRLADRPVAPTVTAQASLAPLDAAPRTAAGSARVLYGDRLQVDVRNLPVTTGYYEVWLIDPDDTTKMLSIGNLATADVTLPLPPRADLTRFRLVDVSAEPFDGDAAHSGRSLLRGTLDS